MYFEFANMVESEGGQQKTLKKSLNWVNDSAELEKKNEHTSLMYSFRILQYQHRVRCPVKMKHSA